ARKAALLRGHMGSAHDSDMIGVRRAAYSVSHPHPAHTVGFGSVLVPLHRVPLSGRHAPSAARRWGRAGQGVTRLPRGSLLSHGCHSLPVPARRKSGALLAAYSTIPEGGHTTDTERQPCRASALITGAGAGGASTP